MRIYVLHSYKISERKEEAKEMLSNKVKFYHLFGWWFQMSLDFRETPLCWFYNISEKPHLVNFVLFYTCIFLFFLVNFLSTIYVLYILSMK
ncbi:unnamed protein product [Ilex paraguariensis]|uniref:Uncharacterized protein n=1 Tax=Ilex paraguariensis TaxID=185542 RepID=A0ABC8UCQ6_9AQUA